MAREIKKGDVLSSEELSAAGCEKQDHCIGDSEIYLQKVFYGLNIVLVKATDTGMKKICQITPLVKAGMTI